MGKAYKNCQSCSMPLKKNPKGGATNKDGSMNTMYCSYCFEDGKFLQPDITATEMKYFVKDKLEEMDFQDFWQVSFQKKFQN